MASVRIPVILLLLLKYSRSEVVKIGVLLPMEGNVPWTMPQTLPAIELAVEAVSRKTDLLPNHQLVLLARDSKCSETEAPLQAVDLYNKDNVHLFIGPACDYAVAPVARFSPRWGIPVLTGGARVSAFHDKEVYRLLTRLMGSYSDIGEFFVQVMKKFNWKHVGMIYSDNSRTPNRGKSSCFFTMEAIYLAVKKYNGVPWHASFNADDDDFNVDDILDQAESKARVLILCASPDHVRRIMLKAHDRIARENYVFFNIDPFPNDSQSRSWYRDMDEPEMNEKARKAYEGLMTVALRKPQSEQYRQFAREVKRRARMNNQDINYEGEVNSFVGAFHDAVILYALALNETLQAGGNISDGAAITRRMWNRTFEGITGTVSIDSNGDRNMDYSLLDMNPVTGKFEVVENFYGNRKFLEPVVGRTIHWAGGRTEPPPDTPPCGFKGEKCPSDVTAHDCD